MSDIVTWKTATEIIQILTEQNALVSGMTVAEAAAVLGYTRSASGIFIKTTVQTIANSVAGTTAAQVAGTAATTTTAYTTVLAETATGTAQVAGVASITLPIASCIAAASVGYLIGNSIYESNDEFLDNLMFPVYDFITGLNVSETLDSYNNENTPTTPIFFDVDGNTFIDSRLQLGIKTFLDSKVAETQVKEYDDALGTRCVIPINTTDIIPTASLIQLTTYQPTAVFVQLETNPSPVQLMFARIPSGSAYNLQIILMSKQAFRGRIAMPPNSAPAMKGSTSATYNGNTVHTISYTQGSGGASSNLMPGFVYSTYQRYESSPGTFIQVPVNEIAYVALYGIPNIIGGLPLAISKYIPGTSPGPLTFPEEVPAWNPVVLPKTAPTETPTPEQTPDNDPEKPNRITPFIPPIQPQPSKVPLKKPDVVSPTKPAIVPTPNPNPDTSTAPYPSPDPSVNPSTPPVPFPTPPSPEIAVPIPPPADTGSTTPPALPVLPPISSSATGLLHVYNPTTEQINQFGAWLWTTFSGDLIDTLSKLFNNPMDAVIGLHELYTTPAVSGETTIRAGYLDSGVASQLVSTRYTEIKCGAISIPEYWNNYLDYTPYTKAFCYLPFIGIVELNADDIIGHGVEITYKIDAYNGSCIALITTAKTGSSESVIYEFSGNCAVEVPITSGMKSAMQSALIGAASAALIATTGPAGAVGGAALVGGVRHGASSKNTVQHSGSFGSSYGAMGIKIPYLIIKRPKQIVVPGYNENYGYPAHKMVTISTCQGYLKAIEVEVISPTATEDEKKMIEKLLKDGVFVN